MRALDCGSFEREGRSVKRRHRLSERRLKLLPRGGDESLEPPRLRMRPGEVGHQFLPRLDVLPADSLQGMLDTKLRTLDHYCKRLMGA